MNHLLRRQRVTDIYISWSGGRPSKWVVEERQAPHKATKQIRNEYIVREISFTRLGPTLQFIRLFAFPIKDIGLRHTNSHLFGVRDLRRAYAHRKAGKMWPTSSSSVEVNDEKCINNKHPSFAHIRAICCSINYLNCCVLTEDRGCLCILLIVTEDGSSPFNLFRCRWNAINLLDEIGSIDSNYLMISPVYPAWRVSYKGISEIDRFHYGNCFPEGVFSYESFCRANTTAQARNYRLIELWFWSFFINGNSICDNDIIYCAYFSQRIELRWNIY